MGLLTESVRGLSASIPFPSAQPRTYVGWAGDIVSGGASSFRLPDERDYRAKVGDGSGTSLITSVANWMQRELIPIRPVLLEHDADTGVARIDRTSDPLDLLRHPTRDPRAPNGFYDGTAMRSACALSWIIDGNVYRWKVRSQMRRVVGYWYVPHFMIEPIGSEKAFIDHYAYRVGGRTYKLDPTDVSHLRFGLDPRNPRKGLSPIRGVLRELYTDEEAARFSAALLSNVGFPGAVIIPGPGISVEPEDRKEIKERFSEDFGADNRGRTIVLSANAEVKFLSWSPKELDLSSMRDIPEERVASAVGIAAAVVGFGTGLQQVKVGATMREMRASSWESALLPFIEALSENDTEQLLPEFIAGADLPRHELGWDLSRVAALSQIHMQRAELEATLVRSRIKRVDEARVALGLPAVGGEDGGFQASPGVGGAAGNADNGADTTDTGADTTPPSPPDEGDDTSALSLRELAVIDHLAAGETNKAIAQSLRASERTVERVISRAMRKTGTTSRAALVAWRDAQD